MHEVDQDNHFWEVCRSSKCSAVQNREQKPDQEKENHIDMVNIISSNFNTNHFLITSNPKHHETKL